MCRHRGAIPRGGERASHCLGAGRAHMAAMTGLEPDWLLFASDAARVAMWGGAFLLAAVIAMLMDRRRQKRDRISATDRVGWMPWTMVFLVCAVLGMGLLAAALPGLVRG